jgi:hypothetical protein
MLRIAAITVILIAIAFVLWPLAIHAARAVRDFFNEVDPPHSEPDEHEPQPPENEDNKGEK